MDIPGASRVPAPPPVKSGGKGSGGKGAGARLSGQGWASEAHANAMAQDSLYAHSVANVFHAQSRSQQKAILKGAAANPHSRAAQVLHGLLGAAAFTEHGLEPPKFQGVGPDHLQPWTPAGIKYAVEHPAPAFPSNKLTSVGPLHPIGRAHGLPTNYDHEGDPLVGAVKAIGSVPGSVKNTVNKMVGAIDPQGTALSSHASSNGGASPLAEAAVTPARVTAHGALQMAENTGKDAWNLGPSTVEGTYAMGDQIVHGHLLAAAKMLSDPYVEFLRHPGATFYHHPLNTAMLVSGPASLADRAAGAAAEAGMFGEAAQQAASRVREPLSIGRIGDAPSPIKEERDYAKGAVAKAIQVAIERSRASRGLDPNVEGHAPALLPKTLAHAFRIGSEAKLNRITDEMSAVRQIIGRTERARVIHEMKVSTKGTPKESLPIVSHVLQGVVRTPETARTDIVNEINRLKAAQTGRKSPAELQNRLQVRDLTNALEKPGAIDSAFKVASDMRPRLHAMDTALVAKGLLDPEQALRARLFPYAMTHMAAEFDHRGGIDPETGQMFGPALKTADGRRITSAQILEHGKANGVPDPAYVGHFPTKTNAGQFYKAYRMARGSLATHPRTGEAFRLGAYDHSFDGLIGQVASRSEALTNASLHDKVITRLGVTNPVENQMALRKTVLQRLQNGKITGSQAKEQLQGISTGYFTPQEARAFAHDSLIDQHGRARPDALALTPVTAAPKHMLELVRDLQHPSELRDVNGLEFRQLADAVTDAAKRNDGTRNVVLVPTVAVKRFADQAARADGLSRALTRFTTQFKRTVLPYSTHWATQIVSEANIRAAIAGVLDPRKRADGRALAQRLMTTPEGRDALAEMVGSTFYNEKDPLGVHNPNPGKISAAAHAFPPTRGLLWAHNRWADFVGQHMHSFEAQYRLMGLGKLSRDELKKFDEFGRSWQSAIRLHGDALEHIAQRLESNPALVAKFGRQIDDVFGKYNKFTPMQRAAIQSAFPFLPWYLNAARFVLWQLPVKSPVASSLLASLRMTVERDEQEGKQLPLNAWAAQELSRLSPFNIFAPPSSTPSVTAALQGQGITDALLPQFTGAMRELSGVNAFGEAPLSGPHGDVKGMTGPALGAAAEQLAEGVVPLLRDLREIEVGGRTTYGDSTVLGPAPKPGTKGSPGLALDRIFNPFYSFEEAKKYANAPSYGRVRSGRSGGLSVPGISVPPISVPAISVPAISVPGISVPNGS